MGCRSSYFDADLQQISKQNLLEKLQKHQKLGKISVSNNQKFSV
jgi:hypothetical protein